MRRVLLFVLSAVLLSGAVPLTLADPFVAAGVKVGSWEECVGLSDHLRVIWSGCTYDSVPGQAFIVDKDVAAGATVGGFTVCAGVHFDPTDPVPGPYTCVLQFVCGMRESRCLLPDDPLDKFHVIA